MDIKDIFLIFTKNIHFYLIVLEDILLRPKYFFKRVKEEETYIDSSKFFLINSILYILGFSLTLIKKVSFAPNKSVVFFMLISALIGYIIFTLIYAILFKLCFKLLKSQITFKGIVNVSFYCTHPFIVLGFIWPINAIPLFSSPKQINIEFSLLSFGLLILIWFYTCSIQIYGLKIISSTKLYKVVILYSIISLILFLLFRLFIS